MKISLSSADLISPNGIEKQTVTTLEIINKALDGGGKEGISVASIRTRIKIDNKIAELPADATELELNEDESKELATAFGSLSFQVRLPIINTLVSELFPE